ncbi:MAG TPA: hypothetical protein VL979_10395 [Solirubrobacteraceae bacterium]|nr:hypothetical protein [Solirubrobacteraceae bacterium]
MSFGVFAVTGDAPAGADVAAEPPALFVDGDCALTPPVPFARALEAPARTVVKLARTAVQLRIHTTATSFVGLRG